MCKLDKRVCRRGAICERTLSKGNSSNATTYKKPPQPTHTHSGARTEWVPLGQNQSVIENAISICEKGVGEKEEGACRSACRSAGLFGSQVL